MRSSRWWILGPRQLTEQEAQSELPHLTTTRLSTSWSIVSQLRRSLSYQCLSSSSAWWLTFFTNRQQGVRLARRCLSKWADILSSVPQQKKSGPWPFLLMIMIFSHLKCKPDTTISEVVPEGSTTNIQDAIESIQTWSTLYRLQLNVAKWKVLEISFSKTAYHFPSLNRLWSAWSSYKC